MTIQTRRRTNTIRSKIEETACRPIKDRLCVHCFPVPNVWTGQNYGSLPKGPTTVVFPPFKWRVDTSDSDPLPISDEKTGLQVLGKTRVDKNRKFGSLWEFTLLLSSVPSPDEERCRIIANSHTVLVWTSPPNNDFTPKDPGWELDNFGFESSDVKLFGFTNKSYKITNFTWLLELNLVFKIDQEGILLN